MVPTTPTSPIPGHSGSLQNVETGIFNSIEPLSWPTPPSHETESAFSFKKEETDTPSEYRPIGVRTSSQNSVALRAAINRAILEHTDIAVNDQALDHLIKFAPSSSNVNTSIMTVAGVSAGAINVAYTIGSVGCVGLAGIVGLGLIPISIRDGCQQVGLSRKICTAEEQLDIHHNALSEINLTDCPSALLPANIRLTAQLKESYALEKKLCKYRAGKAFVMVGQGLAVGAHAGTQVVAMPFLTAPAVTATVASSLLVPILSVTCVAGALAASLGVVVAGINLTEASTQAKHFFEGQDHLRRLLAKLENDLTSILDTEGLKNYKEFIPKELSKIEKEHKHLQNWGRASFAVSVISLSIAITIAAITMFGLLATPVGWSLLAVAAIFGFFFLATAVSSALLSKQLSFRRNGDNTHLDKKSQLLIAAAYAGSPQTALEFRALCHEKILAQKQSIERCLAAAKEDLNKEKEASLTEKELREWLKKETGERTARKFMAEYCESEEIYQQKKISIESNMLLSEQSNRVPTEERSASGSVPTIYANMQADLYKAYTADIAHAARLQDFVQSVQQASTNPDFVNMTGLEENFLCNILGMPKEKVFSKNRCPDHVRSKLAQMLLKGLPKELDDTLKLLPDLEIQAAKLWAAKPKPDKDPPQADVSIEMKPWPEAQAFADTQRDADLQAPASIPYAGL